MKPARATWRVFYTSEGTIPGDIRSGIVFVRKVQLTTNKLTHFYKWQIMHLFWVKMLYQGSHLERNPIPFGKQYPAFISIEITNRGVI
jgi:hypothetical protein